MRTAVAVLIALLVPVLAAASPAEVVSRFVDVLRRDDLRVLTDFGSSAHGGGWRDLRDLIGVFDCISVQRFEWTIVSETVERIELRVEVDGTAELKAVWRPVKPLPRVWHLEAQRQGREWRLVRAMTEERRVALAMRAAPDEAAAERILQDSSAVAGRDVLPLYANALEFANIPRRFERLEHVEELARRTADIAAEVHAMRRRVHALSRIDPARAVEVGWQTEALARAHGTTDDVAGALLTLGIGRLNSDDPEGAVETYAACATMAETLEDPTTAIKCAQMVWWVSHQRDLRAGLRAIERIDALSRRYRWEEGAELVLFDRSAIHNELGNVELARADFRELIRLGEVHGNPQTVKLAMGSLGMIELRDQHYAEAVRLFRESIARFGKHGAVLNGLAAALTELGELDEAESILRDMVNTSERNDCVEAHARMSEVRVRRGDVPGAIAAASEALRLADSAPSLIELGVVTTALANRARAFILAGYRSEAETDMRSVVALVEDRRELVGGDALTRANASRDYLAVHVELVELLVEEGRIEEALEIAELMKARGLRHAIAGGRIDVSASMNAAERAREAALEGDVVSLNRELLQAHHAIRPTDVVEERLLVARRELDAFRAEMRLKHPAVSRRRAGETGKLALPRGVRSLAAIEYVIAQAQVLAFVIVPGEGGALRIETVRLPLPKPQLERDAREVAKLAAARAPGYRAAAARLHAALLAPLERHLRGVRTIAIIPDGVLWTVPFHALVTSDGSAVVDHRAVFYAHSLALLDAPPAKGAATSRLIAFGNPTVGEGSRATLRSALPDVRLGPLVDAEEEVRSLASMYPPRGARVYLRGEARETVFKAEAARYGIIHLAAHAIVDDRAPMYSAIVLAPSGTPSDDGLLEAREVVDLPLNAELAVLSACETARGRVGTGEGMIGLPWAFSAAGCPTTIVSQWDAESRATAKLMVELHEQLLAGETIAEALRRAQLAIKRVPRYSHPFYWAPFVAIGAAAHAPRVGE